MKTTFYCVCAQFFNYGKQAARTFQAGQKGKDRVDRKFGINRVKILVCGYGFHKAVVVAVTRPPPREIYLAFPAQYFLKYRLMNSPPESLSKPLIGTGNALQMCRKRPPQSRS